MSNNDGAAVAISMSVGEELSRLMVQADHLREENERLREALRKIAEWDLTGTAIAALGEEE